MFLRHDLGIDFIEQNIFIACDCSIVVKFVLVFRCKEKEKDNLLLYYSNNKFLEGH